MAHSINLWILPHILYGPSIYTCIHKILEYLNMLYNAKLMIRGTG